MHAAHEQGFLERAGNCKYLTFDCNSFAMEWTCQNGMLLSLSPTSCHSYLDHPGLSNMLSDGVSVVG